MTDSDEALAYVKKHDKELIQKYASVEKYPPVENPLTIFMAGSPGAGKTEFSKTLIKLLHERTPDLKIVRIDPDEIRSDIPTYTGKNSSVVQRACLTGARNIFYYVLKHGQNFIYDGTLSSYDSARTDVSLSINKGRKVGLFYIHQDPVVSWELTKKREVLEGRPVPKEAFIKAYFVSRENVNTIKAEFGKSVSIYFIEKNYFKGTVKYRINIDKIDSFVKNEYNPRSLERMLKDKIEPE